MSKIKTNLNGEAYIDLHITRASLNAEFVLHSIYKGFIRNNVSRIEKKIDFTD